MSKSAAAPLVLGSGSPYRRALLERLHLPFTVLSPDVDESPRPHEDPAALVRRLAGDKARAVAARRPDAVVIASDQLACRGDDVLGKPGSVQAAEAQLRASSGAAVDFLTAVVVMRPDGAAMRHLDLTRVLFRTLGNGEIARYVHVERPLDCAGSFKCEGLGISLFERILGNDPTALTGLPLIWTAATLRSAGFAVP